MLMHGRHDQDSLWLGLEPHPPLPQVGHCQHSPFNKKELHSHFHLHRVISSAYCSLALMSCCQMWLSYYTEKSSYKRGNLDYLGVSNINFISPWGIPKDNSSAKKLQCNQLSSEKKWKAGAKLAVSKDPKPRVIGWKVTNLKILHMANKSFCILSWFTCILVLILISYFVKSLCETHFSLDSKNEVIMSDLAAVNKAVLHFQKVLSLRIFCSKAGVSGTVMLSLL